MARKALIGVGNYAWGEWSEVGNMAFHLRRRLSSGEFDRVGAAVDIRGTLEYHERLRAMTLYLPANWSE